MANLNILVQDGNNINVEVTPTPRQTITVDRGVSGVGIESVSIVLQDSTYYFEFIYTNGTTELVPLPAIITGVTSFNTRIGVVTLTSNDVTTALGYAPPTPTGTGASGTWSISVNGNAGTVTNGVYTTDIGTVTNTMLAGSIANNKLTNSAITINGSSTALGGSVNVGTVTSVTGTAPVVSSGGATPAISMAASSSTANGYLTSTDWNTFNNKTSNTGTVTSVAASAGTGISVTGSPITTSGTLVVTNTAPDQVVSLTGAGTTSITGTYPNFTITSNDAFTGNVTGAASSTDNAVARYDGTTGKIIQNSAVTIDDDGTVNIASNLNFTGVNNRITGDFTNTTNANRVAIQSSTTNGATILNILPNGTSPNTQLNVFNASDATNGSIGTFSVSSSLVSLNSSFVGTGSILPLAFSVGGERIRIDTAGNVGIGTTTPDANLTVNGAASFAAGTALLPSITRSSDLNTGMWFPADDTIAFSEGGTEIMRIDSAGNVGIGTTTPTAKFHVAGNSVMIGFLDMTSNAVISTTNGFGGIKIENTATKTYPTTTNFIAYPGIYQNLELGTAQIVNSPTPGGFNYTFGIQNNLTKSAGNTQDIDRLYFHGFNQAFTWNDLNTCQQYNGILDTFFYSGINANGRISSFISAGNVRLLPPNGGTQTITNLFSPNIIASANALTANINITTALGYNPSFRFNAVTSGALTVAIGTYTFYDTGSNFGSNATGTAVNSTTITNLYGLRLRSPAASIGLTVTNNWGISQEWSSARNVLAGQTSIGGLLGAESLRVTPVTSAVNYLNVTGGTTGNATNLAAEGSDTNINIVLTPKGTGAVGIGGVPSAWAQYKALQIGNGSVSNFSNAATLVGLNWFWNGTTTNYITTAAATSYSQQAGLHRWLIAPSGTAGSALTFTEIVRADIGKISLGGVPGAESLRVNRVASAVNYLQVAGDVTGNPATLSAQGSDTNIDIALTPKGTGNLRFGTHTVSADVAISGYIEVKDSAGNVRKLAVIS